MISHLNQQTKMSYISFIIKSRLMNKMASRRELCKNNKSVIKTSDLVYLLIFLMLNISNCYGWLGGSTSNSWTLNEGMELDRHPRYAEFDPPRILPPHDFQTIKAGSTYTVRCEGSRGVSWRIPEVASSDLRSRISISHDETNQDRNSNDRRPSRQAFRNNYRRGINKNNNQNQRRAIKPYVAVLTITRLKYSDTGTFTCTYNGTTDLESIDNSTSVHLYVDDGHHLLKTTSSFDFLHAVQTETLILPCMPTHPDVNVTLWRDGSYGKERVYMSQYISFDPKVGSYVKIELNNILGTNKGISKDVALFYKIYMLSL